MQVVIDIDEDVYKKIVADKYAIYDKMFYSIKNGTPLPKGHGRIIDESQVTGTFAWDNGFIDCFAPTIIEADTESEDTFSDYPNTPYQFDNMTGSMNL